MPKLFRVTIARGAYASIVVEGNNEREAILAAEDWDDAGSFEIDWAETPRVFNIEPMEDSDEG